MQYVYLHGFASSPDSPKALYFARAFESQGLTLIRPDLNQDDFSHLTITRQLEYLRQLFVEIPRSEPITLIGSSLGGLVSLLYSRLDSRIQRLVLLAPALGFDEIIRKKVGPHMHQWKKDGYIAVDHHAYGNSLPLHYGLYLDARHYRSIRFTRPLPTAIFHGRLDETVPHKNSLKLLEQNPEAFLFLMNSDHSLSNALDAINAYMQLFLHNTANFPIFADPGQQA